VRKDLIYQAVQHSLRFYCSFKVEGEALISSFIEEVFFEALARSLA
jgi:hypothetical protein